MLTLSLFRHAKSSWDDPSQDDFERPLAKRGEAAAPRMGAFMAESGLAPQLILCSPAVRARQTLELALPHLEGGPTVEFERKLYLAAPSALLARLRKLDAKVQHVMIVGHDPGLQKLALDLTRDEEGELRQALAAKLPTAGLVVIRFKAREWARIGSGKGQFVLFMTPKMLT
jgi:phosphohistidine phosphatase